MSYVQVRLGPSINLLLSLFIQSEMWFAAYMYVVITQFSLQPAGCFNAKIPNLSV